MLYTSRCGEMADTYALGAYLARGGGSSPLSGTDVTYVPTKHHGRQSVEDHIATGIFLLKKQGATRIILHTNPTVVPLPC